MVWWLLGKIVGAVVIGALVMHELTKPGSWEFDDDDRDGEA